MPNIYLFAVLSLLLIKGCASSEEKQQIKADAPDSYPHLTELKNPGQTPHKEGKVYIDSVNQVTAADPKKSLLISGRLADGCTYLDTVTHHIEDHSLIVHLSAWRETHAMCTQALVPFSFLYRNFDNEELDKYSQVIINEKTYTF